MDLRRNALRYCAVLLLDKSDRTRLSRRTGKAGLLDQVRRDAALEEAEHLAHNSRAAREQEAQRIRDA